MRLNVLGNWIHRRKRLKFIDVLESEARMINRVLTTRSV